MNMSGPELMNEMWSHMKTSNGDYKVWTPLPPKNNTWILLS